MHVGINLTKYDHTNLLYLNSCKQGNFRVPTLMQALHLLCMSFTEKKNAYTRAHV